MADIYIGMLAGFILGIVISLFISKKKTNKEQFESNFNLYKQLLLKKQNSKFKYSQSVRKTINAVHVALLVEHREKKKS